jgi:hypothetical protein
MLHAQDIAPLSMASDGHVTERSLGRNVVESSEAHWEYSIPNSHANATINLKIPLCKCHGLPCNVCQDAKHGLKTARNQLFTGAHLLAIGNFAMFFSHLRDIDEHPIGPLFRRDVEKVDKQDDRAASRTFSASVIDFLCRFFPERQGLSAYLFVIGELVDAWQNRSIPHIERARMVMRARFFLTIWRSHVDTHPDHNLDTHFVSRDSYEIFTTLCDSLLGLIISHRRFYSNYPLLPWLHSTEVCEHLFGTLRKLKANFSLADFLLFMPKVRLLLSGEFGNLLPEQKANETAAGYHHTYFQTDDIDLQTLMVWPSDEELQQASTLALAEASDLLAALGIDAAAIMNMSGEQNLPTRHLPRVHRRRTEYAVITDISDDLDEPPNENSLEMLFRTLSLGPLLHSSKEDRVDACALALAAEQVDVSYTV